MTIDTDQIINAALNRMDVAYASLRKLCADKNILNSQYSEMNGARQHLIDATNNVFEMRLAIRNMGFLKGDAPPIQESPAYSGGHLST